MLGSVGTAVYRHAMDGTLAAGVPFAASTLVSGAKEAFSHSLALVAGVSALVVLATAVAVVLTLESNPSRTEVVT